MIEFLTLFLHLVWGRQTVELSAPPAVTRIELRLDGAPAVTLTAPPWRATVDLGATLQPRELTAHAWGAHGEPLGETRQWLNFGRQQVEARLVFAPDGSRRRVQLLWQSFDLEPPREIHVTLDGAAIAIAANGQIDLPAFDPAEVHVLEAVLTFADGLEARATLPFGGAWGDRTSSELTALPLFLTRDSSSDGNAGNTPLPTVAAMAGWLRKGSETLTPFAVERVRPQILVVRDAELRGRLPLDATARYRLRSRVPARGGPPETLFFSPRPRLIPTDGGNVAIFDLFRLEPGAPEMGLLRILAERDPRFASGRQQFFDALASAGKAAATAGRPRVALLLLDAHSDDHSAIGWPALRDFLAALRVPLVVWSRPSRKPEGTTLAALRSDPGCQVHGELSAAVDAAQALLDRQVIVWLPGSHLPHQLALTERAPHDVRLTP